MKETLKELLDYLKNPLLVTDKNENLTYRLTVFFRLLFISLATSFLISPIFGLFEYLEIINLENHKVDLLFKDMAFYQIILLGAIFVPIIEELIFRAPITSFKKPKTFIIAFYLFALAFGFIHITNFEINSTILLLSPILVLPQILLGGYFGYIRVKFGLQWSMLLHGTYNAILMTVGFFTEV